MPTSQASGNTTGDLSSLCARLLHFSLRTEKLNKVFMIVDKKHDMKDNVVSPRFIRYQIVIRHNV